MTTGKHSDVPLGSNRQSAICNRKCVEVSAALIFRAGRLLVAQRYEDAHLGGLWEFPGGKREPNETFETCLIREIREELGVEISVGALFEEVAHTYPEKAVHLKFFLCTLLSGEPQPLDCAAVRWIDRSELKNFAFPAADSRLLQRLENFEFPI